jgi:hypothetical protein
MRFYSYVDEDWNTFSRRWYRKRRTKIAINYIPYLEPLPESETYLNYAEYLKSPSVMKIKRINANRIIGWCCHHAEVDFPAWLPSVPLKDLKTLKTLSQYYCFDLPNIETFLLKREPYMRLLRERWLNESGTNLGGLDDQAKVKALIEALWATYKGIEELFSNPTYQPHLAATLRVLAGIVSSGAVEYLREADDDTWGHKGYSDFLEGKNPNFEYPQIFTNYSPLEPVFSVEEGRYV